MNDKKYQNFNILGIIGSILIIISEFIPWFSSISLFEYYLITIYSALQDAFLYLFPLMSGIICLAGNILMFFDPKHRLRFGILNIIGLGFLFIFLLQFIPIHPLSYIINHIGIYIFFTGFILVILNLINKLII